MEFRHPKLSMILGHGGRPRTAAIRSLYSVPLYVSLLLRFPLPQFQPVVILWVFMRRQKMVAQYIATWPILDLCERSTRRPRARVSWRWWEQDGIDLEGAKERAEEAAMDSESYLDSNSGKEELSGASGSSGAEWSGAEEWTHIEWRRAGIEEGEN